MTQLTRKRHLDGKGKGKNSWKKHWMVGLAIKAQAAKLNSVLGPKGIVIDMHAGDGYGTEEPQQDMFNPSISNSTAALSVSTGALYGLPVVLCEKDKANMDSLRKRFGPTVIYLDNHRAIMDLAISRYQWSIILNDPNGHGDASNGVSTMEWISANQRYSDFIVCVNEGSLVRHTAVKPTGADGAYKNALQIQAVRATAQKYKWMLEPQQWASRLGKRHGAVSRHLSSNHAYKGRVLVLTNSLAKLNPEVFGQW